MPGPESVINEEAPPPPGRGPGRGGPERSRSQQQQQYIFYCKGANQGDIGQICNQCQGTPVQDPSCAPAQQGCKVKDDTCFTDQKCQQEYGQEAKAQKCGKHDKPQSNLLLGTNEQQHQRPETPQNPDNSNMDGSMEGSMVG